MSIHNIYFYQKIRKLLCQYPLLSVTMAWISRVYSYCKPRNLVIRSQGSLQNLGPKFCPIPNDKKVSLFPNLLENFPIRFWRKQLETCLFVKTTKTDEIASFSIDWTQLLEEEQFALFSYWLHLDLSEKNTLIETAQSSQFKSKCWYFSQF